MSIYDSKLWISDLDRIIEVLPELEKLDGKRVLVTGCNGLICSAVVDVIIRWNVANDGKIYIIAAGRNEKKIKERFLPYYNEEWFSFFYYDATSCENNLDFYCDYIIHGASNASPSKIIKEPVETMMSNFMGVKYLLDYAKKRKVKRVIYISSSEVYGKKEYDCPSKVDDYGGINILNTRSSYSISKCAAETLCVSYFEEYEVDTVIVRPGHIYGPTATISDNRVSSAWAYAAARGENIIMKSDGAQIRSYCYCLDCASAILKVLLTGEEMHVYNISNPDSVISIKKFAELLVKYSNVELKKTLPTESERKGFNPMNNSSLNSNELLNLGWKGVFDALHGISHTVSILRSLQQHDKRLSGEGDKE